MRLEMVPAQLFANEQCATTFCKAVFTLRVSDSVSINVSINVWKKFFDTCLYHWRQVSAVTQALMLENGFQIVSKASPLTLTLAINTALSWVVVHHSFPQVD